MVIFKNFELIIFNKFIEQNNICVLGFLELIGIKAANISIKGDNGKVIGVMDYKGERVIVRLKFFKREITEIVLYRGE